MQRNTIPILGSILIAPMREKMRLTFLFFILGFTLFASAAVDAYVLKKDASCYPSMKWGTSNTVKVRLLIDSVLDYDAVQGLNDPFGTLWAVMEDIKAVVDEYNSVSGIDLELEWVEEGLLGDDNLEDVGDDDYNNHSVIIGFTDEISDNPAWTNYNADDDCIMTEVHIRYRKPVALTFGAPDSTDVNGKSFGGGMSFRATLLHEMGHAVGLLHETDEYAVMNHGTKAWTRGRDEVPQMQLLPDDINGLRAIYGNNDDLTSDVSLTNTWFIPADEIPDDDAAQQKQNCSVSSRGDSYADHADALVPCGVNDTPSAYPTVSDLVCPGNYVQVRYTLNNNGDYDVEAEEQLWFSDDDALETSGADIDFKSPDTRAFTIAAGRSATIGRVYRVPADTPDGQYHVFARVMLPVGLQNDRPRYLPGQDDGPHLPPHDDLPHEQYLRTASSSSPLSNDADEWNNAIRLRSTITVDTATCP